MSLIPRKISPLTTLINSARSVQIGEWAERTYPAQSATDWIGSKHLTDPYRNALAPYHGEEVFAATPLFQWPDLGADYRYRVRIYDAGGAPIRTLDSEPGMNYLLVPVADRLPVGAVYRWTVQTIAGPSPQIESEQRYFYVREESTVYEINVAGSGATLGERLFDKLVGQGGQPYMTHPRSVTKDPDMFADMVKSLETGDPRRPAAGHVEFWMTNWEGLTLGSEVSFNIGLNSQKLSMLSHYWKIGGSMATRARDLCKKIVVTYCTPYNGLTSTSSVGFKRGYGTINGVDQSNAATRYDLANGTDQNCRAHILLLARGYDLFKPGSGSGNDLTEEEATRLLEFLDFRIKQMYDDLFTGRDLQKYQYESHGINNIGYLSSACCLIAEPDMSAFPATYGLASNVTQIIKGLLPVWLHLTGAFRCDDGSSHAGGGYDNYDAVWNPMIYLMLHMFSIDLLDKPKFSNAPKWRLLMNGIPGSRQRSQFGDNAAEEAPYLPAYAGLSLRYRSGRNTFTYPALTGTDYQVHNFAFLPSRGVAAAPRAPELLSAVFPSGGYYGSIAHWDNAWATAVYMRSSPHGGFNHAHHDMNGIVVWGGDATSGPRMLLIDGGYYNLAGGYGLAHWRYWHRDSRAHNTLSMDNGAGQQFTDTTANTGDSSASMMGKGKIVYWKDAGDYSCTIGDATQAYSVAGYSLSSFLRAVVHFRNDVILVLDYALSNSGAHTWDWNFHTDDAVTYAGGVYTISSGTARGYVQNLYCNSTLQAPTAWDSVAGGARASGQYNYTEWDGPPGESGTVTGGSTSTLQDSTKNWAVNSLTGSWGTVNGTDFKIRSNTATSIVLRTANNGFLTSAPSGAYTLAPRWSPGPPAAFANIKQHKHRISTATPTTEYKAVTSICVGSNNLLANVNITPGAQSITVTATIQGRQRTVVFNFVNRTLTVT